MELIRNTEAGEFGIEGEVFFREFDKYIGLSVEDDNLNYANQCAPYLNDLSDEILDELCKASIRYCNGFLKAIGEPLKVLNEPREVLKLIYPSALLVPYPENSDGPVLHLELNCEWEEEHGMEWVIRDNKVLYVGAFNGEDPFDDFTEQESWNYA